MMFFFSFCSIVSGSLRFVLCSKFIFCWQQQLQKQWISACWTVQYFILFVHKNRKYFAVIHGIDEKRKDTSAWWSSAASSIILCPKRKRSVHNRELDVVILQLDTLNHSIVTKEFYDFNFNIIFIYPFLWMSRIKINNNHNVPQFK